MEPVNEVFLCLLLHVNSTGGVRKGGTLHSAPAAPRSCRSHSQASVESTAMLKCRTLLSKYKSASVKSAVSAVSHYASILFQMVMI